MLRQSAGDNFARRRSNKETVGDAEINSLVFVIICL